MIRLSSSEPPVLRYQLPDTVSIASLHIAFTHSPFYLISHQLIFLVLFRISYYGLLFPFTYDILALCYDFTE
jgi:hypothetical protein